MNKLIYFINMRWLLLSLVVGFLDVITKFWVVVNCPYGQSMYILSFLNCYYIHNFGVSFSLLSDFGVKYHLLLSFVIILIILGLVFLLCRLDINCNYWLKMGYAVTIGGALGNVCDRICHGVVIDFIDLHIGNFHWPIFNIADLSISIGAVCILCNNKL